MLLFLTLFSSISGNKYFISWHFRCLKHQAKMGYCCHFHCDTRFEISQFMQDRLLFPCNMLGKVSSTQYNNFHSSFKQFRPTLHLSKHDPSLSLDTNYHQKELLFLPLLIPIVLSFFSWTDADERRWRRMHFLRVLIAVCTDVLRLENRMCSS